MSDQKEQVKINQFTGTVKKSIQINPDGTTNINVPMIISAPYTVSSEEKEK